MITGIEDISRTKQKAVLEFISIQFDLDGAIEVEEEDDDIIVINNNRYFVIRPYEEDELMDDLNNSRFDAAFDNLSEDQKRYVDKDQWIDDKGVHEFIDYLKCELNEMPTEDCVRAGGYNFYEL